MCGIAGFYGYEDGEQKAILANQIQFHRGPDHQGVFTQNDFSFAHQRLSIIDIEPRSNQPFIKDDHVIVFNGEIYNYKSVKASLIELGHSFSTESDTEVLLVGYIEWGEELLQKIEGMFAFSIFCKSTEELFIARDCFGIKPLYYFEDENHFCFASELKTLVKTNSFPKEINIGSIVNALNYLWIPGSDSMFKNVFKLLPGHYLRKKKGESLSLVKYWEVTEQPMFTSEEECIANLEKALDHSIENHMVADVPVGSFLSGGLDSALLSYKAKELKGSLNTYCIGTSDKLEPPVKPIEDEDFAHLQAKDFGYKHVNLKISSSIIDELPHIVKLLDEPIGDPAAINTYLICKQARENGEKVMLSGMGADEILFGYIRHKAMFHARFYNRFPGIIKKAGISLIRKLPTFWRGRDLRFIRWFKRFMSFAVLPENEAYLQSYSYYNKKDLSDLFVADVTAEIDGLYSNHQALYASKFKGDMVNQICNVDIQRFMTGLNLRYTDKASMGASVEVRVPYISKSVVEVAMRIPGKLKYKNYQTKYPLRKIGEKYLDKKHVNRPKASFGVPLRKWVKGELKEMVDDLLSETNVTKRGLFKYPTIKNLIDADRKGEEDNAFRIYQLLTIELWYREYID